jgi:hypothetical protein
MKTRRAYAQVAAEFGTKDAHACSRMRQSYPQGERRAIVTRYTWSARWHAAA